MPAGSRPWSTPFVLPTDPRLSGALRFERTDRTLLGVEGRSPARMFHGLVTGRIPGDPVPHPGLPGLLRSEAPPSLVLTPKGRILTDLHLLRTGAGEAGGFLLDLPTPGWAPLEAHLARFLPPRFARATEFSPPLAHHTVVGPGAAEALARALHGAGPPAFRPDGGGALELAALLQAQAPGEAFLEEGAPEGGLVVVRNRQVDPPAWDLIGAGPRVAPLLEALEEGGTPEGPLEAWHTLRMEAGTPEVGREIDEEALPHEAGVERTHVDHQKGCYTGQEVVVRIRDRGRVNRHLRGLLLGDHPLPDPGTPLFIPGREREGGQVLTVAWSPRWKEGIALAWARREAEPGSRVHLGSPEGPAVEVRALGAGWGDRDPAAPGGDGQGGPSALL